MKDHSTDIYWHVVNYFCDNVPFPEKDDLFEILKVGQISTVTEEQIIFITKERS